MSVIWPIFNVHSYAGPGSFIPTGLNPHRAEAARSTDNKTMMGCMSVDCISLTLVPGRQTNGHSGILTFKIKDNLSVTSFQKLFTEGSCHICVSVPASPQPCQHKCERELSIFFNLLGVK